MARPDVAMKVTHDGTVLRAQPLSEAVPVTAVAPTPTPSAETSKKNVALWAGIAGGGFVVVAAVAVVVVLLLGGKGLTLEISAPAEVSTSAVPVKVTLDEPEKIGKLEFCVDGKVESVVEIPTSKHIEQDVAASGVGDHELCIYAYSPEGRELARQTCTFSTTYDFKADVAQYINSARSTDDQIRGYANRINQEMSYGYVRAKGSSGPNRGTA